MITLSAQKTRYTVGQQYKLRTPFMISFIALADLGQSAPLPTSRKWFRRSAIIRAVVQVYNDRPLGDM